MRRSGRRPGKRGLLAAGLLVFLAGCERDSRLVIASKNFTEQVILGEMAAQQIERTMHVEVKRKLNLGGTLLAHQAIVRGDIDIYPEYTGTAISVVLKQEAKTDRRDSYLQAKAEYERRFHLQWLSPLGFNDTFAMVVRDVDAAPLRSPSLTAAMARAWRLGVGYEFLTRPDGLARLNRVYQPRWNGTPRSMDLGLLYQALRQGRIDMGAANSTDGQLMAGGVKALEDDRHAFPAYDACYVVRDEVASAQPESLQALQALSGRISEDTMRQMNRAVDIDHRPVVSVVREFLARQ